MTYTPSLVLDQFMGLALIFICNREGAMKTQRKICDFTTSRQRIAKVKSNGPTSIRIGGTNTIKHGRIDLDTHAYTIVFGQSFILLSKTGR